MHVNALDLVVETNNMFMHALYSYLTTTLTDISQGIRDVIIKQLTKEVNYIWGPVMINWAKKQDPMIANMGVSVTAKQVIQNSAIVKC